MVADKRAARSSAAERATEWTAREAAGSLSSAAQPDGEAAPTNGSRRHSQATRTGCRDHPHTPTQSTAKKTGAKKVAAKKDTTDGSTAVPPARDAAADGLAVRPGEDPWTEEEVTQARDALREEARELRAELEASEEALAGLMRDSGDGAGDDQADAGTKNVTREHEMALASNAREMLRQTERAEQRLAAGTYGLCESCGKPIGKARMQAFPRATLCVDCKQRQERRY